MASLVPCREDNRYKSSTLAAVETSLVPWFLDPRSSSAYIGLLDPLPFHAPLKNGDIRLLFPVNFRGSTFYIYTFDIDISEDGNFEKSSSPIFH